MGQVTVEQALQMGIQHHQAGQLRQAENVYRQILLHQPNHADSLHLLGLIAHQTKQHQAAIELMQRAIAIRPNWPDAIYNLAIAFRANGQMEDAIAAYKQAILQRIKFVQAHNGLASALQAMGKIDEAIAAYQQAVTHDPNNAEVFNNLGVVMQTKGELQQAISAYRNAIAKKSDYSEAHANLGIALRQNGQLDEAIVACRRAVTLNPKSLIAYDNLGLALMENGEIGEAILAHRQALSLNPISAESAFNLANALAANGQSDEAIVAYRNAIAIRPDYAAAHNNLGKAQIDVGEVRQAITAFDRARQIDPENSFYDSAYVFALHYQTSDPRVVAEEHFRWGNQHACDVRIAIPARTGDRRLRVGYISPDFRNHPVGRFLLPLLQHHDHQQFEIFCYSDVVQSDGMTERLRSFSDHWKQVAGLKHDVVTDQIRADGIDILVDLTGHSTGGRLLVFAAKPAPLQVSYLGYPSTTGMSAIDYRLTDHWADPVGLTEHLHTETLYRLPKTNWCFAADEDSPPVVPPPFLRNGYVAFGSFNNLAKVTDEMLHTWRRILDEAPSSRLLLKTTAFKSASARDRVSRVLGDRATLLGPQPDHAAHLAAYSQIDIALDTFPYHGTATTCEALWMGVPVVSLAGRSHISRVGVSLLTTVDLQQLVASTIEDYIKIAAELAKDQERLITLRSSLRERMKKSPLMNATDFARDVEAAYRSMLGREL